MSQHNDNHGGHDSHGKHTHSILPDLTAHKTFAALLVLTGITVGLSFVHLGAMNYVVGMVVAFTKATLVASIFMNLRKDDASNTVIFSSSLIFLAIFITLTSTDILFRGDVSTGMKPLFMPVSGPSKLKKPWESTPELVAHGKELFAQQCISCHGAEGKGDGAAAAALNPHPRNFTQNEGWKNGRRPSNIFKTLKEGVPGSAMASFATLPSDDRWALVHFVGSIGTGPEKDDAASLAKIGYDPTKENSGAEEEKTIPIDVAMKQLVREAGMEGKAQNIEAAGASPALERYNQRLNARSLSNK